MTRETGSMKLRRRTTLVLGINPRGARHLGADVALQTSHEGSGCQAGIACLPKLLPPPDWSLDQPSDSFLTQINRSPM